MFEDTIPGRGGQPIRVLRTDRGTRDGPLTAEELTDEQVQFWYGMARDRLFFEAGILFAECRRRGLATSRGVQIGQQSLPGFDWSEE
jgi:hypothetical protein